MPSSTASTSVNLDNPYQNMEPFDDGNIFDPYNLDAFISAFLNYVFSSSYDFQQPVLENSPPTEEETLTSEINQMNYVENRTIVQQAMVDNENHVISSSVIHNNMFDETFETSFLEPESLVFVDMEIFVDSEQQ